MAHNKLRPGTLMPFGKFKGKTVDELPNSYLNWLLEQDWFEKNFEDLYEVVEAEAAWREEVGVHIGEV